MQTIPDPPDPTEQLNPRQAAFVQEYLIDTNATQAAIRAGYSQHTAKEQGSRLLAHPVIADRIASALAQRLTRTRMSADTVLHEMSLLANSRLDWFIITEDGQVALAPHAPHGAMGCIQSIKRKTRVHVNRRGHDEPDRIEYDLEIKLWDKPTPLKLMGRHVGLFADRVELTGKDGKDLIPANATTETLEERAKQLVARASALRAQESEE